MTTYFVDSGAQALRGTGIVEPVMEWAEDPVTGRRRPSDRQTRADDGRPLWAVEVSYVAEAWGRHATVVAKVIVPSDEQPAVASFEPVAFTGLVVSVTPTKSGGLRESWRADGIGATSSPRRGSETAA